MFIGHLVSVGQEFGSDLTVVLLRFHVADKSVLAVGGLGSSPRGLSTGLLERPQDRAAVSQ